MKKDIKAIVEEVQKAQREQDAQHTLPVGVNLEVEELVKAIRLIKISLVEVDKLIEYQYIRLLLRSLANYVYFISRVTKGGAAQERNNKLAQVMGVDKLAFSSAGTPQSKFTKC